MFDNYEKFKKDVYALTKIDLNYYKEKQMRRRIDTIATKHGCSNYDEYIRVLKTRTNLRHLSIFLQSMSLSFTVIRISGS